MIKRRKSRQSKRTVYYSITPNSDQTMLPKRGDPISAPSAFNFSPFATSSPSTSSLFGSNTTPSSASNNRPFVFGPSSSVSSSSSFGAFASLNPSAAPSFFHTQNPIPLQTRELDNGTSKKASDHASLAINTYDERILTNTLMSKSPVKEEAKSVDSLQKNKNPVEIKHKIAKREPISNSALPITVVSRILRGIPQNPHFLQLRRYSETARSNLTVAWDRTFEETIDQIHDLRAVDFWVRSRKLWKTMEDLQSVGYDVLVLRKRVVELSDAMLKLKKRQNEIDRLRDRAEAHRMEKSRLESVILNLRARAQREQDKMVEALIEVEDKQKDLPELELELANLAIEPLEI